MINTHGQNATIKLHTAKTSRKAESTEKFMSPQALTPPLRSPFAMYTANQPFLDSDNLVYHEEFHPDMESNILTHWRGTYQNNSIYFNVIQL